MGIDGERIRMRENHWGPRDVQSVAHGVGADVREIRSCPGQNIDFEDIVSALLELNLDPSD